MNALFLIKGEIIWKSEERKKKTSNRSVIC